MGGILAAAQARREEEERRAEEARRALELAREQERRSWQRPASPQFDLPPSYQPPAQQQVSRPATDTSAPMMDSGYQSPTVESEVEQSYQRNSRNGMPQAMGLSDRLRDPYNAPNRPMLPTQAQGPAAQEQQQSPWKMPSLGGSISDRTRGNAGGGWATPQDQFNLTSEQQAKRDQIYSGTPEQPQGQNPFQNFTEWYSSTPAYDYVQAKSDDRRAEALPTIQQGTQKGIQQAGIGGALGGAIAAGIQQSGIGREIELRVHDAFDRTMGVADAILSDTPIPGLNVSASEFLTPTIKGLGEAFKRAGEIIDPTSLAQTNANLLGMLATYTASEMGQSQQLRKEVQTAIDAGNPEANLALRNMRSGQDRARKTLDLILNRDKMASNLEEQAILLQDTDPLLAGTYFAKAQELKSMSNADMVDQYMDPVAEIAYGIAFDPTNFVSPLGILGLTPEANALRRANRLDKITVGESAARITGAQQVGQRLTEALPQGAKQARQVYDDFIVPFQSTGERITDLPLANIFKRTPETRAALDSEIMWRAMTSIFKGVHGKGDARMIMEALLTNPASLVRGIGGLSEEAMQRLAGSDGLARWAPGLLGDNDVVRRFPLLQTVKEELRGLKSLAGEGSMQPYDFFSELHGVIHDGARRIEGAKGVKSLPFAAATVGVERVGQNTARVAYFDSAGKVVHRGMELSITEAQRRVNEINNTVKSGGKNIGDKAIDVLKLPANIQRAILSDVWLGLSPGNWLANAAGATTMLVANDAYTLMPNSKIQDYFGKQFGGIMPNMRLQEGINPAIDLTKDAKSEVGSGAIDWLARNITRNPDNRVSRFMNGAYDIPYGSKEIPLPNGQKIPFSENSFFARSFFVPYRRTYESGIDASAKSALAPRIQTIPGMTPEASRWVVEKAKSLAKTEGRNGLAQGIREAVGKPTVGMTLKEIGMPAELLMPQEIRAIENLLSDATTEAQVWPEIQKVLNNARNPAAQLLSLSPAQQGLTRWTAQEMAEEAGHIADSFIEDAIRAGMDPEAARAEAVQWASQYVNEQNDMLTKLHQDLASAPNNADTWSIVMDFWQDYLSEKRNTRSLVDELGRTATMEGTPEAWAAKWQGTKRAHDDSRVGLTELGNRTRVDLSNALSGQPYTSRRDWWNALDDYIKWDEIEFHQARSIDLGSPDAAEMGKWQKVIDANRNYLDNSVYDLFGAFQKYPNLDNFDIAMKGMQRLEAMGARTAADLAGLRQRLAAGDISKVQYAKLRNKAWNTYFDAGVVYTQDLAKTVVYNGLVEEAGAKVRWTDIDGTEYQLVRPSETPGKWWARNIETGGEQEFSAASAANEANPWVVPQDTIKQWKYVFGNNSVIEEATEQVVDEIAASAPQTLRPIDTPDPDMTTYNVPDDEFGGIERPYPDAGGWPVVNPTAPPRIPPTVNPEIPPGPHYPNAGITEEQIWGPSFDRNAPVEDFPRPAFPNAGITEAQLWDSPPVVRQPRRPRGFDDAPDAPASAAPTPEPVPPITPAPTTAAARREELKAARDEASEAYANGVQGTRTDYERPITFDQWVTEKGIDRRTFLSDTEQADYLGQSFFPAQNRTRAQAGKENSFKKKAYRRAELMAQYEAEVQSVPVTRDLRPDNLADQAYVRVQEKRAARMAAGTQAEVDFQPDLPTPTPIATIPTNDAIRKAASDAGIATATKDGRPTDRHLVASLNKRMGTTAKKLDDLTDAQRLRAPEVLAARKEEQLSKLSPAEAQKAVEEVSPTPAPRTPDAPKAPRQPKEPKESAATASEVPPLAEQERKFLESGGNAISKASIVKRFKDRLNALGYSDSKISRMSRTELDNVLLNSGTPPSSSTPNMKEYDYAIPSIESLLGSEKGSTWRNLRDAINRSKRTGKDSALQVGEVAEETISSINDLERRLKARLPELLRGTPNNLTGAQRLAVIDAVLDWATDVDHVATKATKVGESMANWMMLNYNDKRHFDTALSILTPFHYWVSRMPSRLAMAALQKPGLVNLYYESNRAIDLENEQADIPDRLRGTLPIPGTGRRFNARSWLNYALPFGSYLRPNPFVEEDATDNEVETWLKKYEKFGGPGLFTHWEMVADMRDGKLDKNYSSTFSNMIPVPGIGAPVSSLYQAATGKMPSGTGWAAKIGFGPDTAADGFGLDAYRARRAIGYIAVEEGLGEQVVGYANQVVLNQYAGEPVEKGIPPEFLDQALALAERGVKRAAQDRLIGRGASYLTRAGVQPYPEAEQQMRQAQAARNAAGYSEANPYGSKGLQNDITEATPLSQWWAKNSETPALDAQISALHEEAQANDTYDELMPKIEALEAEKRAVTGEPAPAEPQPYQATSTAEVLRGPYVGDGKGRNPQEQLEKHDKDLASKYWDEYFALPEKSEERAQYLRDNPGFIPYYDANEVSKGREVNHWWNKGTGTGGSAPVDGATPTGGINLAPGSVSRDDFSEAQLDQYYKEYHAFNKTKDWDAQKAWLLDHPEFARMEADRKLAKDGKYPFWYDDVLGGTGGGYAVAPEHDGRAPSQPVSRADILRQPYDAPVKGGASKGSGGTGRGGAGADSVDWSASWDEYRSFGDDWNAKRQYLRDNPDFAAEYLRYIREQNPDAEAWWLEGSDYTSNTYQRTYYGGGGGGGGGYGGGGGGFTYQNARTDPRYMDRSLWDSPGQQRQWIPYSNPTPDWLRAGEQLAPQYPRPWQMPRLG